jgi:hypothetical protein
MEGEVGDGLDQLVAGDAVSACQSDASEADQVGSW